MERRYIAFILGVVGITWGTSCAQLPPRKTAGPNPWNGTWRLSVPRSSAVAAETGIPQAYRFTLGPGTSNDLAIKWEIPELGEVVTGRTNGKPMTITRSSPSPGLSLEVRAKGSAVLEYVVRRNGLQVGGGRMMLVDNDSAWVDLTWPEDREDLASELVYVKQ